MNIAHLSLLPQRSPKLVRRLRMRLVSSTLALALILAGVCFGAPARAAGSAYLVKDINTAPDPQATSQPQDLVTINQVVYFSAEDASNGRELWRSDGTAAGTTIVKDISPGVAGSNPSNLINVGGTLFFSANNATSGIELWKSNGTATGTVLVRDIFPGAGAGSP